MSKKIIWIFLFIFLLGSPLYFLLVREKIKDTNPESALKSTKVKFKVSLKTDKKVYKFGEPIIVTAVWKNISNEDILTYMPGTTGVTIRDDQGKLAAIHYARHSVALGHLPEKILIKPKETYKVFEDANKVEFNMATGEYEKLKPGQYTIGIERSAGLFDSKLVNRIKVKVVE